jgi:UDP-2,3-diacylglucosamine pyrophosphatase LpxH
VKKTRLFSLLALLCIISLVIINHSCKKNEEVTVTPEYLTFSLPRLTLKHDLYYSLNHKEHSIEIEFSQAVNDSTVSGNITLEDKTGTLDSTYDLTVNGRNMVLAFKPDYQLHAGWKYRLTLSKEISSTSGLHLQDDATVQLRTTAPYTMAHDSLLGTNTDSTQRNVIAVISDIHMGDARANADHYCWFGKNAAALNDFLDYVVDGNRVRQLVILGDLFDEWLIPYTVAPFDSSLDVHSSYGYCMSVAANPVNSTIFDKLKAIALNPDIELIYVRGNHDMLVTQETLEEIIPNVTWSGDVSGLGKYSPVSEMIMEHGHRYDFFNCPQPLVNTGHMLPPGYFVSRLYAQGLMEAQVPLQKELWEYQGSIEFLAAWEIALLYTLLHFDMQVPDMDAENILMTGIDGYPNPFSFHEARDMYAADIENNWDATQSQNNVPVHLDCCIFSIWNGHSDLFAAAMDEYMLQPPAPQIYKMVAFGHTHEPMIEVYPAGKDYTSIYANSGSWVNSEESSYDVRTYLMINPAAWTGSDLDVVSLYQYNLDTENGSQIYKPVLIAEENIEAEE